MHFNSHTAVFLNSGEQSKRDDCPHRLKLKFTVFLSFLTKYNTSIYGENILFLKLLKIVTCDL